MNDGLPETLEEVVAAYGHRYFKLKVAGDLAADVARLREIAAVLDPIQRPTTARSTATSSTTTSDALLELWQRMQEEPRLARLATACFSSSSRYAARMRSRATSGAVARKPVIIDESDDALGCLSAGARAGLRRRLEKLQGPVQVSDQRARAARAGTPKAGTTLLHERRRPDTQAGLALQQELALVSLLGIRHVERNGHHYVNGMAAAGGGARGLPAAHPGPVRTSHGAVRVRIDAGRLAIGSLAAPGFAAGAYPDWETLTPMASPSRGTD